LATPTFAHFTQKANREKSALPKVLGGEGGSCFVESKLCQCRALFGNTALIAFGVKGFL
jgi:hypothetical protein